MLRINSCLIACSGIAVLFVSPAHSRNCDVAQCNELPPIIPDTCEVTEEICHEFWETPVTVVLGFRAQSWADAADCDFCDGNPGQQTQSACITAGQETTHETCAGVEGEFSVKTFGTGWKLTVSGQYCYATRIWRERTHCVYCGPGERIKMNVYQIQQDMQIQWDIHYSKRITTESESLNCGVYEIPCTSVERTDDFVGGYYLADFDPLECPDDCPAGNPTALGLPSDLSFDEFVSAVTELEALHQSASGSAVHAADSLLLADSDGYITSLSELYEMLYCAHADVDASQ